MKMLKILVLFSCLLLAQGVQAQNHSTTKTDPRVLLEKAKQEMAVRDFTAANRSFRQMLELKTVLPTEMCYFFANTLYQLGQYENSLRFVEKYEKLTGKAGEYLKENEELKSLLKKEMEVIRACTYCDSQGYVLENCQYCEGAGSFAQSCGKCFGHERIKCKSCSGEGVVIEKDHFGQKNYQTCKTCGGSGLQTCTFCEGSGEQVQNCRHCQGSGRSRTNQLCTHSPEARIN